MTQYVQLYSKRLLSRFHGYVGDGRIMSAIFMWKKLYFWAFWHSYFGPGGLISSQIYHNGVFLCPLYKQNSCRVKWHITLQDVSGYWNKFTTSVCIYRNIWSILTLSQNIFILISSKVYHMTYHLAAFSFNNLLEGTEINFEQLWWI